ncbi:MAG: transglutaminase-like domain-containing protein [Candidatus Woesearchaeota archaeon]
MKITTPFILLQLFIVLFVSLVFGEEQSIYNTEYLILENNVSSTIMVTPEISNYRLQNVKVSLSFFPRNTERQNILSQYVYPNAEVEDSIVFSWKKPQGKELSFGVDSRVMINGGYSMVTKKVDFPLWELPLDIMEYTKESETIDSNNPKIKSLATELAYGESDLAVVVHKIAEWVNLNIKYNLNTLTAEATQKASWVLDTREGVCDEITNLFIATCRSLGIPARFVSGVSYTTSENFAEPWNSHGWAEVYFPGYGWVPYDVTYGEFMYTDATHLKLKDSLDSNRTTTKYEWEGYKVKLDINSLDIKTRVVEYGVLLSPDIELIVSPWKKNVGFGSYNIIEAEVHNLRDYYVDKELMISQTEELDVVGERRQFVLLAPRETKKVFWILRTSISLDPNYLYTFVVSVYTTHNESALTNFTSSKKEKVYSLSEVRDYISFQKRSESKTYSNEVGIICQPDRDVYYRGDVVVVNCTFANAGNVPLSELNVCLKEDCRVINLGIAEKTSVVFSFSAVEDEELQIRAENSQVSKISTVGLNVFQKPVVEIAELSYPNYVQLDSDFNIEFVLKSTASVPKNVRIRLQSGGIEKEWFIDNMSEDRKFILSVQPYSLTSQAEKFSIIVTYQDLEGRKYGTRSDFTINVEKLSIAQKSSLFLNRLNVGIKHDAVVLLVATFVAGVVVGIIFIERKKTFK